jgi:hypothetical protein
MRPSAALLLAAALTAAAPAFAVSTNAFDCGPRTVVVGQSKLDIALFCPKPTLIDRRVEQRPGVCEQSPVEVEEWLYNLGPDRQTRTLRFEDGRLVDVLIGDYGR